MSIITKWMVYLQMDEDYYLKIKNVFESGLIKKFSDLMFYIKNKKQFSREIKTTYERVKRIRSNPGTIQFEDIHNIAQLFDVDQELVLKIFYAEYVEYLATLEKEKR